MPQNPASSCPSTIPLRPRRNDPDGPPDEFRRPEDGCLFPVCMVGAAYSFLLPGTDPTGTTDRPEWCDHRARELVELRSSPLGRGRLEGREQRHVFTVEFGLFTEDAAWIRRIDAGRLDTEPWRTPGPEDGPDGGPDAAPR